MEKSDGILIKVDMDGFELLNKDPTSFWRGVKSIYSHAFYTCHSLKNIDIPKSVLRLEDEAFYQEYKLEKITLPISLEEIGLYCFSGCFSLKEIAIPPKIKTIPSYCFSKCLDLESVEITPNVKEIKEGAFSCCEKLKKIDLLNVEIIETEAFNGCGLEEVAFGNGVSICVDAFTLCKNLNKIIFRSTNVHLKSDSFSMCDNLKYVQVEDKVYNINLMNDYIIGEYGIVEKIDFIFKVHNGEIPLKKTKNNIKYPLGFYLNFCQDEALLDERNKYFKDIYDSYKNEFKNSWHIYNYSFYSFAYIIGCFDDSKMSIDGREVFVNQKMSVFLKELLDKKIILLNEGCKIFQQLVTNKRCDDEFLKFIVHKNGNCYENFEYLLSLGKDKFSKVISDFSKIKDFVITDEKGRIIENASIKRKINQYFLNTFFEDVKEGNMDLVCEFYKFPTINQEHFDKAQEIRGKEDINNRHLLNKELKEKSIIESIEILKKKIDIEEINVKKILDDLYKKEFTYEWLDKHDPKNFTLGLYCDCCASIVTSTYGSNILAHSILDDDIQNMVIKNKEGVIIAKATLYVNKKFGYAVFNDIEMNRKYGNEIDEIKSDYSEYGDKIYDAFKRGTLDFINEYNKKNRVKIKQVNIGFGHNRLKKTIMKIEKKSVKLLGVPNFFIDALEKQYVVYKK